MSGGLRAIARGESNFDIVGRRKMWLGISLGVLVLSLVGMIGRGLVFGQEFTGGTSLQVVAKKPVTVAAVEDALAPFNLEDVKVQLQSKPNEAGSGTVTEILVRSQHVEDPAVFQQVRQAVADAAGESDVDLVSIQDIGPTWGQQVSSKALRGLIIFLVLVTLYISFRFEWRMAAAALVALFHDLIATAGLYALIGFVVTPATVIALLTLLGYSLYDTVVVFDKVQENTATMGAGTRTPYDEVVNRSVNEVMMRSINTSLSTLIPIGSLLFVGVLVFKADTLKDLALAMFIGTIVGTYSSIFVASPFLAFLKGKEKRFARAASAKRSGRPARAPRPAQPRPERAAAEPATESAVAVEEPPPPLRVGEPIRVQRQKPQPRKKRRGKRR